MAVDVLNTPGAILRKLVLSAISVLLTVLVLFVALAVWGLIPRWLKDADELERMLNQKQTALRAAEKALSDFAPVAEPSGLAWWNPWNHYAYRQQAEAREKAEQLVRQARMDLAKARSDLENNTAGIVRMSIQRHGPMVCWVVLIIFLGPLVWRAFAFWILVPVAGRWFVPSQLLKPSMERGHAVLATEGKSAELVIPPGERFAIRTGAISRRQGVQGHWALCARPRAPLICGAARLWNITIFSAAVSESDGSVTLTTGDPDDQISFLELRGHEGMVVRPGCILGVSQGVKIQTRWRFGVHDWMTGRIRYVLLSGTGKVVLCGRGGVTQVVAGAAGTHVEQRYLAGYDAALQTIACRTENFPPYLFGQTTLLDQEFRGVGMVLTQRSLPGGSWGSVHGFLNGVFQGFGKLFGL